MRFVCKLLNIKFGCFIEKRFDFTDLFNKIEFNKLPDENEVVNEDSCWEFNPDIERRIHVLTGYDCSQNMVVEKGYLHWLFRDVDMQCLEKPKSFDLPMILALQGAKKWGDILLNAGANEEQIDLYYRVSGILFVRVLDRIYNKNLDLFRNISNNYSRDETFRKLISYSGDTIDGL